MPEDVEPYVRSVMRLIPTVFPDRDRIEQDLRNHLADRIEAGATEAEAVAQMGPAMDVAREFVRDVPLEYASPWERVFAQLIDFVVLVVVAGVLLLLVVLLFWLGSLMGVDNFALQIPPRNILATLGLVGLGVGMLPFVALFFYFPIMEAIAGRTVGKWALGLYVVDETGLRIGFGKALLRRLPWFLQFFWVDAVFAFFTRAHQRAFDIVAHTIVIRYRR